MKSYYNFSKSLIIKIRKVSFLCLTLNANSEYPWQKFRIRIYSKPIRPILNRLKINLSQSRNIVMNN